MKKLPLFITIAILIVFAGGYFFYQKYISNTPIAVWDLVPAETILVYESSGCEECIAQLNKSSIVEIIQRAAFPEDVDSLKALRDFILASNQSGRLTSLHITKNDNFDFTFYVPLNKQSEQQFALLKEYLKKIKGVSFKQREFNEVKIEEVLYNKKIFSWIQLDNILVASFTPVLIEDVIRAHKSDQPKFRDQLAGVYQLPRMKKDGGNVFLHLKNFTNWFSLFTKDEPSELIKHFGQSALLDVKVTDDNKFVLNGFSLDSANRSNYVLSAFSNQNPVPFSLKQLISNRSIMFVSYGISDGKEFIKDLAKKNNRSVADTLKQLSKALQLNFNSLYENFSGEIGLSWVESKNETTSKILMISNSKGIESWLKTFNTLSDKLSVDTIFSEAYANYRIREIPVFQFPQKLLAPFVTGFDKSYYTALGNTILIGEDLEELKRYLEDIDKEETWGKSVAQNKFLEATLLESNISLFVNTPKIWNTLGNSLQPRWKTFIQQNKPLLNSVGMGAIQFSHLNDSYYTNVSWSYKNNLRNEKEPIITNKLLTTFSDGVAKIFVLKSYVNKGNEVLVQDSSKIVSLISSDGQLAWKLPLDNYITSEIYPVDFYKNGKYQYFFTTPGLLHMVDRLGNYVKPYPVALSEQEIEFVSVVDYDHTKKYRFLISGKTGKLWMLDKEGNTLDGWKPRIVDESLSTAAKHHRILGKDYIMAIRDDGFAYLMNRRGELLNNFPVDLNARPLGDYYIEIGKSKATTFFVVISRDGFRIKFNLEGKIQSRETLVKNTIDAKFSLIAERESKSYLIVRQEAKQFTIFDENLNEVLASDFIGSNPVDIEYQHFGGGESYITITDTSQDLSFIYDGKGKLLTAIPIESKALRLRHSDTESPKIFYFYQNSVVVRPLN